MPVNSVNFNLGSDNNFNQFASSTLKSIRSVQGMTAKNSITAMTKDLILQYPVIMDSDIDSENMLIISKSLERQYAALQLALWSADTAFGVDTTTANGTRDFIKKYHSNSDDVDKVSYVGNLIRNINSFIATDSVGSNLEIEIVDIKDSDAKVPQAVVESLWDVTENSVNMSSINDMYKPNRAFLKAIESIATAMEAKTFQERYNKTVDSGPVTQTFNPTRVNSELKPGMKNATIIENKNLSNAEPTMLEIQFFVRDGKEGSHMRSAIIGVKTMVRVLPTTAMMNNIINSCQNSNFGYQYVKYTRGENKIVRDFVFNVSNIKADAINRDAYDKWFVAMRKRKRNAKAYKGGNANINPYTTIVISAATAQQIKETAGYDLMDIHTAQKLMNELYLLGFMVVDQSTGIVYTLFDDFGAYATTTIAGLKASTKSDVDYSQLKDVLKLMGRV